MHDEEKKKPLDDEDLEDDAVVVDPDLDIGVDDDEDPERRRDPLRRP